MLRTRSTFQLVNTVGDFLAVRKDTRALDGLSVQNEALCLYAILKRGVFAPHPWTYIKETSKTPAVELLTAVTAPRLLTRHLTMTDKLIPEVTIATMLTEDMVVWDTLPSFYKTPAICKLYQDLCRNEVKRYHWGLGTFGV